MKRVFNLLVVDESGSMSIIEHQALVGINETLTTIQKMQKTHKNMISHAASEEAADAYYQYFFHLLI
jgi:hypothetical protein